MAASTALHYIYDPLCGWCYGAEPLIQAARQVLPVVLHGGGMMAGNNRQFVSSSLRDYIMPHDRRIAEYTGQPFGQDYFEGLLRDSSVVFDSTPPTRAVLAAEQLQGRGLDMLQRLQVAHYVEGRHLVDVDVLLALAAELGFEAEAFKAAFEQNSDALAAEHFKYSRGLLSRVGGQGFPTLALEKEGRFSLIDISPFLGKPEAFAAWLGQSVACAPVAAVGPSCDLDGCSP
ncbi:DsbA family protein [Pseudomonas sp. FEN]|uniref:DsbA family protein n=1 Tax=Pseudomonas sp. FEN TaxID=2767468 RepID=UPI00174C40BD|nr:DsbA family protein [Pseudomonas sp. FEN]CAD5203912.1 Thioredoxin-like protein clustered with PA0057 [Pseudomonas sp. FEN]